MVAPAVTKRRSGRSTGQPSRYRAGSDLPTEFQDLVHTAAADAVSKSAHSFEAGAVVALEEALEPMLEALCKQALEVAKKDGREEISPADLKAVSKNFKGK
eukprot:scaffold64777_cov62-Phaeocystis_antarctica.AAC.5